MLYTELEYPNVITTLPSEILEISEKVQGNFPTSCMRHTV